MLRAPNKSLKLITSALIPFVPRQVMLDPKIAYQAMENEKNNKKKDKKKSKTKSSEPKGRGMLINFIASFLETNGFNMTLSVFRSEANLKNEDLTASFVNLEDLFCKFLESSKSHEEATIDEPKEKDLQKAGVSTKDESQNIQNASEHIHKKNRKHRNKIDDVTKPETDEHGLIKNKNELKSLGDTKDLEKLKSAEDSHVETKDKKRKKKSLSNSLEENADKNLLEISCGTTKNNDRDSMPTTDVNDKAKRKKKHKMMSSDICDGNTESEDHNKFQEIFEEKIGELKSLNNISTLSAESNAKHKGEKKKKTKETSVSLAENGNDYFKEDLKKSDLISEYDDNIRKKDDNSEKKAHKKRKRLTYEERALQGENGTISVESKHAELEGVENNKESGTLQKPDKSLQESEQTATGKKRKTEKSSETHNQTSKISSKEQDPSAQDVQKESGGAQLVNGNLEKNEKEGGSSSKSMKKEKRSAEPKTVNAFQRVKVDEVKFADERLQDNSYWALDGGGSGYGAKAQEVLGQVKGRDFRHEKTKKKRGSYRGGQIDLQSHSIKFNYSDEE